MEIPSNIKLWTRGSMRILLVILLAVGLCSALHAIAKPFWYDELNTLILCRLPGASEIWKALDNAADVNPPVFYLVARLTRQLVSEDHLGYRLPSILGLLGAVFCVYAILSRRVNHLSALVGATFLLCTPLATYAYEARPYALMVGCISGAILGWQRVDDSRLYSLVFAIALAAAVSLHYYAILVWPAFLIAEAFVWIFRRRFRVSAWAALLVGALPLLFFAPLLLKLRQYYGQNFWAKASIQQVFLTHNWLFNLGDYYWGVTFAVGVTVIFLYLNFTRTDGSGLSGDRQPDPKALPIGEQMLTLILLWLPLIAVAAAKLSHGGMTDRYMLPAVLGGALALGYVIDTLPNAGRVLLLTLLLVNYGSSSIGVARSALKGSLLDARTSASREMEAIVAQNDGSDLPVVISHPHRYLRMAFYTPAASNGRLWFVADPQAAVTYSASRSDTGDLSLLALRHYFPLQVEDYAAFLSRHTEFLLVSGTSPLEWWPARLVHEGYAVKLVSVGDGATIYRVNVKP